MRVLASGDHHFKERSRFAECVRVHRWLIGVARDEKPDVFLSGGDIYDSASTPLEREAVAEFLTSIAEVSPVVISKGNHDRPLDVELMRRLRTRHPIIVEERAGVHHVAGAAIGAIAWPEPAYLMARAESSQQANADVRMALQNILRGLGMLLADHDGPRILLGHLMVDGSETSTGQPLLGQPINVSLSDLALVGAQLGIMGHIHKAQVFDVAGAPHWYTGSSFRTAHGEMEKKVVLLAEFNGAELGHSLHQVQQIETPATPMVHFDFTWGGHGLLFLDCGRQPTERELRAVAAGAEVRLRYRVANAERDAARAAALELERLIRDAGAIDVKVEQEIDVETRARMPEVVSALRPADKLQAFWAATGFDPGPRREPLLAKFSELEAANDAA